MGRILVGTREGLHEFDPSGRRGDVWHTGRRVNVVAPEGFELWAVVDGREIWHTAGVDWWFRVAELDNVRGHCMADTRAGVVVGASHGCLFRVAGEGLEPVAGFERADGREAWYTPWGGQPDVRTVGRRGVGAVPHGLARVVREQH